MLYANSNENSPTRGAGGTSSHDALTGRTGAGGSSAFGGASRIPDDELKPEVVSAIDLFDPPGRINRPRNVSVTHFAQL